MTSINYFYHGSGDGLSIMHLKNANPALQDFRLTDYIWNAESILSSRYSVSLPVGSLWI